MFDLPIVYDSQGRMKYHPDFHENQGKPYTKDELMYICSMWDYMDHFDISLAIGKTQASIENKVYILKKQGLFEHYRMLGKRF